jgi:hypothetical protein
MSDRDDFVAETHSRLVAELQALHNGDPNPQLESWSTQDPVTLFGAKGAARARVGRGQEDPSLAGSAVVGPH